jgi:hypothetical protein
MKDFLCLIKYHVITTYSGNGGIAPRMEVSGRFHALAVLPQGKQPLLSEGWKTGWTPQPF